MQERDIVADDQGRPKKMLSMLQIMRGYRVQL